MLNTHEVLPGLTNRHISQIQKLFHFDVWNEFWHGAHPTNDILIELKNSIKIGSTLV